MGLDLSHIMLTSKEDTDDYEIVLEEELTENPHLLEVFAGFLTQGEGTLKFLSCQFLGEQRKGMSNQFYHEFKPGWYFDRKSVERAYHFLQADHYNTSLQHLQDNFQKNFVNNFQEGKSVFHVSY